MKRLIKWFFFLVLLLIVVGIAAPFFIPLDSVKKIASERVKAMTGRDLVIAGDVKARFWPNIGVSLQQVTLSNPEGFSYKYFAEIGDLTVAVELMPLLSGKIKIEKFVINKPVIHLEMNKKNARNWQFSAQKPDSEDGKDSAVPAVKKTGAVVPALGKIKIEDGAFSYSDLRSGKVYNARNVDLEINIPSPDSAVDVIATMALNKEKLNISLHVDQPLQLTKGGDSNIKTNVKIGSLLSLAFEGKANMQGANGAIDLNVPSLVDLSAWSGKKLEWSGDTALALNIKGAAACTIADCTFGKSRLKLDDAVFNGDMKINFASPTPTIEAKLATDKFNLNHYLSQPKKQALLSLINSAQAAEGWSSKPLNFSGLRAVNANLVLDIGELLYRNTSLSKMSVNVKLANGALALDIPYVELYSGTAKISASVNSNNVIAASFNADKLQVEPLLQDFAQFDRLTGLASINASISGSGASQSDVIYSLSGKGAVQINDGTIRGVDIAKLVNNAKAMVTGVDTSSEKTKFSELGGTFAIAQGIVKNDDLTIKSPLLRVKGVGTVDFPRRYVNYRIIPSVVATLQGQGGKDKVGLDIPVIVEGSFEKLKFTPDLGSIVQDSLKDPEKIKETVKTIKDSVKNTDDIKKLLKGFR